MLKESISEFINELNKAPKFLSQNAKRGEFGKTNVTKAPSVIAVADFGIPENLDISDEMEDNKKHVFKVFGFIVGPKKTKLIDAEDATLDLLEKVVNRITIDDSTGGSKRYSLPRVDGSYEDFEFTFEGSEWVERQATGCVIAAEFEMRMYI